MGRKRVDVLRRRVRPMTKEKKVSRKKRVRMARARKGKAEEERFYLAHPKDRMRCAEFRRSHCGRGHKCKIVNSEADRERRFLEERHESVKKDLAKVKLTREEINSLAVNEITVEEDGWVRVTANLDTGAAITAIPIPVELKEKLDLKAGAANSTSYKTASGELILDGGGATLYG